MLAEGLRRRGRIRKEIAILLFGSDLDGRVFSEHTSTVVLSRHGAGIVSANKLSPEQEIIIRCLDSNKEAVVRVVGQIGSQSDSYTYGVAFLEPDINFWNVEFPTLTESETQAGRLSLECSSCKSRLTLDHSDLESDVYAINGGVLRYCRHCGSSTLWKQALEVTEDNSISPEPERKPEPSLASIPVPIPVMPPAANPAARPVNRRKHVRAKVNLTACIRNAALDEDVVVCEDMSRGGLRFKSHKRYYETSMIEVAVPYSPDALSIFVSAQIIYVEELAEQKLFRCGVAYLKSSRNP